MGEEVPASLSALIGFEEPVSQMMPSFASPMQPMYPQM